MIFLHLVDDFQRMELHRFSEFITSHLPVIEHLEKLSWAGGLDGHDFDGSLPNAARKSMPHPDLPDTLGFLVCQSVPLRFTCEDLHLRLETLVIAMNATPKNVIVLETLCPSCFRDRSGFLCIQPDSFSPQRHDEHRGLIRFLFWKLCVHRVSVVNLSFCSPSPRCFPVGGLCWLQQ